MPMMNKSLLRLSIWIALGLTPFVAPACSSVLGTSGPSPVAQGMYYSSGNPHFDEFFVVFHDSQVAMGSAGDRAKASTATLVTALGLPADTNHETLLDKTKLAADELESGGIHVRLTMPDLDSPNPPAPSAKVDTMGGTPDDAKRKIIDAIQDSANEGLKLVAELRNRKTTLTQLRVQAITLDTEVDDAFRKEGPGQKHDVHKNLQDAQKLVPLMDARADEVLRDQIGFLKSLKPAVDRNVAAFNAPTAPPEQPQPPEEEKPKKKKSKSSAKSSSSAPAPAAPAPAGPGFEP
jgi:hypothetical protein